MVEQVRALSEPGGSHAGTSTAKGNRWIPAGRTWFGRSTRNGAAKIVLRITVRLLPPPYPAQAVVRNESSTWSARGMGFSAVSTRVPLTQLPGTKTPSLSSTSNEHFGKTAIARCYRTARKRAREAEHSRWAALASKASFAEQTEQYSVRSGIVVVPLEASALEPLHLDDMTVGALATLAPCRRACVDRLFVHDAVCAGRFLARSDARERLRRRARHALGFGALFNFHRAGRRSHLDKLARGSSCVESPRWTSPEWATRIRR